MFLYPKKQDYVAGQIEKLQKFLDMNTPEVAVINSLYGPEYIADEFDPKDPPIHKVD